MNNKTIKYLEYGQFCFFFFISLSYLLLPQAFLGNRGFSFLGTQRITLIPSSIGFLLTSYFMFKASKSINSSNKDLLHLSRILKIFSILIIGMVLTPFSISNFFNNIHFTIGTILYTTQIYLIIWIIQKTKKDIKNILLFIIQIIGTALLLTDKLHIYQIMMTGQLLSQISFALILIHSSKSLLENQKVHSN